MAPKVKALWYGNKVLRDIMDIAGVVAEPVAKAMDRKMKRGLKGHRKTGKLEQSIGYKKSKYRDGGYIVGVLDSYSPGDDFAHSLAGRAWFLNFGHAGPYDAYGRKVTTPVPFATNA